MPVHKHHLDKIGSQVALRDMLCLIDLRLVLCAGFLIFSPLEMSAAERYTYECEVQSGTKVSELNGFTLEWTDIGVSRDGIAGVQELREDPDDVTGDHNFLFQPDAYITLDGLRYNNDPEAFFTIKGDHEKNLLQGFFLAERMLHSLSISTWGSGEFNLVKHEVCAEIKDLKCRDIKLFEGHCVSLGLGKEFKPIEVPDY